MAQVKATLPARTNKGSPTSPVPKTAKASKSVVDRKPTSKFASLPEVKENLKKVKEEKSKVVKELEQVKKTLSESNARIQALEEDVNRAKASERKMLESMVSQTKLLEETKMELEETKMELEEAKLETNTLKRTIQNMGSSEGGKRKNAGQSDEKLIIAQEEIKQLKIQLLLAAEAEEKSEGTMGDLAAALKEVATEANQMKEKLLASESEMASLRVQADSTKSILRVTQEKLRSALEESSRSKTESEEQLSAWNDKENELRVRIRELEEEIARVMQKNNSTLIEAQNALRKEISNLQEQLKNSESEANIVKEALEKATNENSELKCMPLEKGDSIQADDQEHLRLDTSMTLSYVECRNGTPDMNASLNKSTSVTKEARRPNSVRTFRSESRRNEDIGIENSSKESGACSGYLEDSNFTMIGSSEHENDQMLASISSASDQDGGLTLNADEFQHVDGSQLGEMQSCHASPDKKTTKKQMFQKLGVMLKGKKLHK